MNENNKKPIKSFRDLDVYQNTYSASIKVMKEIIPKLPNSEKYDLKGISTESIGFPPFEHGYHHEMSFVRPNYWLSKNLGLCFCKYCVIGAENADIDAAGLKNRVAKKIDDYLAGDVDYSNDMAQAFWLADVEFYSHEQRLHFRDTAYSQCKLTCAKHYCIKRSRYQCNTQPVFNSSKRRFRNYYSYANNSVYYGSSVRYSS